MNSVGHEHENGSMSDVDGSFLIKVTRKNSVSLAIQQQRHSGQRAGQQQQQCCSTLSLCYDSTIWNWSSTVVLTRSLNRHITHYRRAASNVYTVCIRSSGIPVRRKGTPL